MDELCVLDDHEVEHIRSRIKMIRKHSMTELDALRGQITALEKWTQNELNHLRRRIDMLTNKTYPETFPQKQPCTT